jgi:hypothetical protein
MSIELAGTGASEHTLFFTDSQAGYAFTGGNIGIGTILPTEKLTVVGNINQTTTGQSLYNSYLSGITGTGWSLGHTSNGSNFEVDNITVRNTLRTHIFQKDVVKATNGILYVSDSGVISGSRDATHISFRDDKSATFNIADELWYKDANSDTGTIESVRFTIANVTASVDGITEYGVTGLSGSLSVIQTGATAVRTSGGVVVIDASSTNSPYIDVVTEGVTVVRTGNLAGITSPTFGSLGSTYGF